MKEITMLSKKIWCLRRVYINRFFLGIEHPNCTFFFPLALFCASPWYSWGAICLKKPITTYIPTVGRSYLSFCFLISTDLGGELAALSNAKYSAIAKTIKVVTSTIKIIPNTFFTFLIISTRL